MQLFLATSIWKYLILHQIRTDDLDARRGLFAIAAFFIKRRTKEIGIRKVMGASVAQITWLVSAEFLFIKTAL